MSTKKLYAVLEVTEDYYILHASKLDYDMALATVLDVMKDKQNLNSHWHADNLTIDTPECNESGHMFSFVEHYDEAVAGGIKVDLLILEDGVEDIDGNGKINRKDEIDIWREEQLQKGRGKCT